jgi:hypothetical protein
MDRAVPGWFLAWRCWPVLWEAFGCYIYVSQSLVPDGQREGGYAQMASWQWGVFATGGVVGADRRGPAAAAEPLGYGVAAGVAAGGGRCNMAWRRRRAGSTRARGRSRWRCWIMGLFLVIISSRRGGRGGCARG